MKNFIKKNKYIFFVLIFIIILSLFFLLINKTKDEQSLYYQEEKKDIVCEDCLNRLIDGQVVRKGEENPFLIAAIIDNHSDAKPQFGFSWADIVYDIPAEGGINRYLALFRSDLEGIEKIGPIRSARPYFLDIAKEYQALLLHCGGSPEALARIAQEKLLTLNEFYNSTYFERYYSYAAPHNILAFYNKIKNYLIDKNLSSSNFSPWSFKNSSINNIDLSSADLKVEIKKDQYWEYDLETGLYYKKIYNDYDRDDSDNKLSASNIILQFVDTKILDQELRIKMSLVGKGDAIICLDAYCHKAYWEKEDEDSRTFYYLDEGQEFVFNIGKTWIHLIDSKNLNNFTYN